MAVLIIAAKLLLESATPVRDMVKGAPAVVRFDVWQGERRIEGAAPTMRKGSRTGIADTLMQLGVKGPPAESKCTPFRGHALKRRGP